MNEEIAANIGGGFLFPTSIFASGAVEFIVMPTTEYAENNFGIGLGAYFFNLHSFGYYGNTQFTNNEDSDHYEDLNISSFGDPVTDRRQEVFIFNLGTTFQATGELVIYGGVGYADFTGIGEKNDPSFILSPDGSYTVPDPENDDSAINFNFGFLFFSPGSRTIANFGMNTEPRTFYIGFGVRGGN